MLVAAACGLAHAGVTLDGSMGRAATLSGPAYVIDARSGRSDPKSLVLFQSFGEFSLTADEKAVFTGPGTIQNIFVRVTGGAVSSIEGLIDTRTSMPYANLFLLNPSGILFGGSAKLNVGGSFHAATADSVRFADDVTWTTHLSQNDTLSVAPPKAFGFLGSNTGTIAVNGGALAVDRGKTLSLIGGQPTISAGSLKAPGGLIQVINAGPGETTFTPANESATVNHVHSQTAFCEQQTTLPEGSIIIRSGRLLLDHANILSDNGAAISIKATDSAQIIGGEISSTASFGAGGDINITAGSLLIKDHASIASSNPFSLDPGGAIAIHASTFVLSASSINSSTDVDAAGGSIDITVPGSVLLTDRANIQSSSTASGLPGAISLQVGILTLKGGATLGVGLLAGTGSGDVSIVATDAVALSEHAGIITQASGTQPVGAVTVQAPLLRIDNGFISSSTVDTGRAGDITLNVNALVLTNGGQIASGSLLTSPARAGDINVPNAASITISGASPYNVSPITGVFNLDTASSGIFTTTAQGGEGGNIQLAAAQIELHSGAKVFANSTSTSSPAARAGNIDITFGDRLLVDHGTISTASKLADGGNITIKSTGSVLQLVNGEITTSVGSGAGGGGNITLGSVAHPLGFLALSDSVVDANAFGGPGGNIGIFADVFLKGNGIVSASSQLSTPGTIDVQARITDVSGSLAQLPGDVLQAPSLLRAACAARTVEGKTSSVVVAGREGTPQEPGGLLGSPLGLIARDEDSASDSEGDSNFVTASAGAWSESSCARSH